MGSNEDPPTQRLKFGSGEITHAEGYVMADAASMLTAGSVKCLAKAIIAMEQVDGT